MRAEIRYFHSPDVEDLENWSPETPDCFSYLLQVFIGPKDGKGEESFDFIVCTPAWLKDHYSFDSVVPLRHYLLVFRHQFDAVRKTLEELVDRAQGDTWNELAIWLASYGKWEFDGYSD